MADYIAPAFDDSSPSIDNGLTHDREVDWLWALSAKEADDG